VTVTLASSSSAASADWWRPTPEATRPEPGPPAVAGPVAFGALLLFTFILVVAPQQLFPALQPLRLALITAIVAAASLLVGRIAGGGPLTIVTPEIGWAGALLAWALLTIPLSYWPTGSAGVVLDIYAKTLVLFWLLSNTVVTSARLRIVLWTLALLSVPLALTALRNFRAGLVETAVGAGVPRIMGYQAPLTTNPNDLALMLNLILPLAIGLLLATRGLVTRAMLATIVGLCAAAVVCTFSRGGFVTLAFVGLAYAWRLARRTRRSWLVVVPLVVALLGVPLLPAGYLQQLRTVADIESDPTGSAPQRLGDMWAAAGFVVAHPLVGAGLGMGVLALNDERGATWTKVHNVYLEHAVDLGLPGLMLFLLLVRAALRSAKAARGRGSEELAPLAEGIHVSLAAFVVAGMFHPVAYQFYFYYVAGLAVAARQVLVIEHHRLVS
jgi:putative inorganic carbon (hco3(-)) transporter